MQFSSHLCISLKQYLMICHKFSLNILSLMKAATGVCIHSWKSTVGGGGDRHALDKMCDRHNTKEKNCLYFNTCDIYIFMYAILFDYR